MTRLASPVALGALDLCLGAGCAGCRTGPGLLCPDCRSRLGPARPVRPDPRPPGLPPVAAAGSYGGPVREALIAHKERGRLALAGPLGRSLADAVSLALRGTRIDAPVSLVPVPSRPGSARRRGHDPLLRLARVAAARLRTAGRAVEVAPVLRVRRRLRDQSGLDAQERWDNLQGALAVPAALRVLLAGRHVVLVDDVLTTGATLAEAARALRAVRCPAAAAAVVAATERHAPPVGGSRGPGGSPMGPVEGSVTRPRLPR